MNKLGIIAGGGSLPVQIVQHCKTINRPFFIIFFDDHFDIKLKDEPHAVVRIGAVGEALSHLRSAGVSDVVMAGGIKRPPLSSLKPDASGAELLAKIGKAFFSGDDALLRAVTIFFEEEHFNVVGVDSILKDIVATEGVLGDVIPDKQAWKDIKIGMKAAKELGAKDIGQAVIVENNMLLATEDDKGTDALIKKAGILKKARHKSGVLVKTKKPEQEEKVDLPSIGIFTIENLYTQGFAGVAVEAGASLLIERGEIIKKANEYGLFVVGVKYE